MQKIIPHLWFDKEAKEAGEFYVSLFPQSKITDVTTLHNTPSGDCDVVNFTLEGHPFMAISAGPLFKFNPSISFVVSRTTQGEIDALWNKLAEGGAVLMELGKYPWNERYGWIQDRYGLSWQLALRDNRNIIPSLLFVKSGKAKEAVEFYASVFHNSSIATMMLYQKGEHEPEGTVKYASFTLDGNEFAAMDGSKGHQFAFNEAISFIVRCDTQEEIDYYWNKLSAVPESEQCGWLKDKYGVSWQIVPAAMNEMMSKGTPEQIDRLTQVFLLMKKFDIAKLKQAYDSR